MIVDGAPVKTGAPSTIITCSTKFNIRNKLIQKEKDLIAHQDKASISNKSLLAVYTNISHNLSTHPH